MHDTQAFVDDLLSTSQEQALTVIHELLKMRPELAKCVVSFACPMLTYAPARGMSEQRSVGILKSLSSKGFGFIACPELLQVFGGDVFVHMRQMGPYASILVPGTPVTFAVVLDQENKPRAYDVQPMDGALADADPSHAGFVSFPFSDAFPGVPAFASGCPAKRKRQEVGAQLGRYSGVIKSLNTEKGFGFVSTRELDSQTCKTDVVLFRQRELQGYEAGNRVTFTAFINERRQVQAKDLQLI
mmetsp:Transcript_19759/g.37171  ORF Transcript_19759/g.37171 Transcript_19759/m.37171 type:complete len:243 (+) Transcript_19759:55-783(+)